MSVDKNVLNEDVSDSEPMEATLDEDMVAQSTTNGVQVEGDSGVFAGISPTRDVTVDEPIREGSDQEVQSAAAEHVTKVEDTQDTVIHQVELRPNSELETPVPPSVSPSPVATPAETITPNSVPFNETPNYKTKYILSGHRRSISSVKFNPAGTILASAGECFHQLEYCLKLRNIFVSQLQIKRSSCGIWRVRSSSRPWKATKREYLTLRGLVMETISHLHLTTRQ
jgi:WD40 repeat protein